jgi:hypothetical protein
MSTCPQNNQPARDELLPFQGLHEIDGLCHVRTYERPGRLPVVIAGELDDNPGTKIRKAISSVARAIQDELFVDGREFVLVEYRPARGAQQDLFELVPLACGAEGALVRGGDPPERARSDDIAALDSHGPARLRIDEIAGLTGCPVATWRDSRYEARTVAGLRGEYLRRDVAARGNTSVRRMMAMLAQR